MMKNIIDHHVWVENIPNNLIEAVLVLSLDIMECTGCNPNTMNSQESVLHRIASTQPVSHWLVSTPRYSAPPSDSNSRNSCNGMTESNSDVRIDQSPYDVSLLFSSIFTNDGKYK